LNDHLQILQDYAFITFSDTNSDLKRTYRMPNLVQAAVHEWLRDADQSNKQHCEALLVLHRKFEHIQKTAKNDIDAYIQQRHLLPHVDHFVKYCREDEFLKTTSSSISLYINNIAPALVGFARLYVDDGRYHSALLLLEGVRDHYQPDDVWSAKARRDLAETIRRFPSSDKNRSGELSQGRVMLRNARATAQNIGNQKAEYEAISLLAMNYRDAGEWKLAEKNQTEVIKHMKDKHKDDDSNLELLNAKLRWSQILFYRGRAERIHDDLKKAEGIQYEILQTRFKPEQVIDIHCKAFLDDVRASLSRTYFALGNYLLAEQLARIVYDGRRAHFGDWDLKTMRIAQDLALCLLKLGKTDDAKKMLEDTCRRLSDKLGSKHLLVSKCEENLKAVKEAEEARKGKEREKVSLGSPSLD
jgi:hypothetical protein